MSRRRVVVTGMGLISPLGNDLATSWDGIVNARSGIGQVERFDVSAYSTKIAGEIKGFDPSLFVSSKLGNDLATSWDGIVNARSGIGQVERFDVSAYSTKIAGEIKGFDPSLFVSSKSVYPLRHRRGIYGAGGFRA